MAEVTLRNAALDSADSVKVLAQKVIVSGKANLTANPIENGNDFVEVQTQSYENTRYVMQGVRLTEAAGTITYKDILALIKLKYNGLNHTVMQLSYGNTDVVNGIYPKQVVAGIDSVTTDIPVILESYSMPLDTSDSRDAYLPIVNLVFIETKTSV